ncbi:SMP-30/gluconolactonase/LRE family protein [Grimontia marina]|uniref:Gluconolactonase n=1 Tax=Grimontia marina TaxID=646534 RepID=A0A128EZ28_9GAMM|nr:SMP-30/gluconolactonase/LRE family protein [Grimontia marina]CZF79291.1 Gluconolactonase precursor [Grimontia marina]
MDYTIHFDDIFAEGKIPQKLCSGVIWAEGPVWLRESNAVLFSDVKGCKLYRWSEAEGLTIEKAYSHFSNGNYLDLNGNLISCEHGRRCISKTSPDGVTTILVDNFDGKRLNSPNDVVVKRDGSIWFTDPPYGILGNDEGFQAQSQIIGCHVYRFDPQTGDLDIMTTDVQRPNGLAFSPDEQTLYVADMSIVEFPTKGRREIRQFTVDEDGSLGKGETLCIVEPGIPDGFRVDIHGNIFCSCDEGIAVFTPTGEKLGLIPVPERVSNCTFGGEDQSYLFITATTSLYGIKLNTKGVQYAQTT